MIKTYDNTTTHETIRSGNEDACRERQSFASYALENGARIMETEKNKPRALPA